MNQNNNDRQRPISIGEKLPKFCKKAIMTIGNNMDIIDIDQNYASANGKWMILFWWPKDFTFVCPTEIIDFDRNTAEFSQRNATVVGASTDSEYVHQGWRQTNPGLTNLSIPMLADTSKSLASEMGILDTEERVPYRATFIVDPSGIIQWVSIYPMNVGRNVDEVLRVLDALQTEELTACGWTPGEKTLTAKLEKHAAG
ncbi:peroxiredoxin [Pedobacter sp. KBW06]|uniref:peroxiredoxin n=1 Tax=Pedobacter sp. KBW06 TaxID=2153359 RepID=UPI0018F4A092|nr:peroxiredoxin [Pedobacter sp. KBW06]